MSLRVVNEYVRVQQNILEQKWSPKHHHCTLKISESDTLSCICECMLQERIKTHKRNIYSPGENHSSLVSHTVFSLRNATSLFGIVSRWWSVTPSSSSSWLPSATTLQQNLISHHLYWKNILINTCIYIYMRMRGHTQVNAILII